MGCLSVGFICEASEGTAIIFCVWERPLLPVLRVQLLLCCAQNVTPILHEAQMELTVFLQMVHLRIFCTWL
jgi:hypothetical protein